MPLALTQFPALAPAQNLVANPLLLRDLPPPGWIADRRAEWVSQHPVYASKCQTPDVAKEIEFLNRVVNRDENLLVLAGSPPQGNSALAREAKLANQEMGMLRNDIAATDALASQLQRLPACAAAEAAPTKRATAAAPPVAGTSAATRPPPAPAVSKPAAAGAAQTMTLRFDDKAVALTPRSIRVFDQAVEAIRAKKPVRLAIDGCGSGADFSLGAVCGERLRSLETLLKKNGVRDPKRLFAPVP